MRAPASVLCLSAGYGVGVGLVPGSFGGFSALVVRTGVGFGSNSPEKFSFRCPI